jgi:DNA-binding SARP family transcriptional activator
VLIIESDWVQLDPQANLWLDVAEFEQAFHSVQHLPDSELNRQDAQTLANAVNLYGGGLQESWYQDWYLYERERFQHLYLVMLDKLMDYREKQGDYAASLTYGTYILGCARARERTHRRLMRLHYLAGDRTAALRQYEHCVRALNEELGVGPAKRTVALRQQIAMDQLALPALAPGPEVKSLQTPPSLGLPMLHCLKQLQETLTDIQCQIGRDIQALELTIEGSGHPSRLD